MWCAWLYDALHGLSNNKQWLDETGQRIPQNECGSGLVYLSRVRTALVDGLTVSTSERYVTKDMKGGEHSE